MGLVDTTLGALFGGGRNVVKETVEVFRENAEGAAVREAAQRQEALRQYAAEFALPRKGVFDRLMDGLNRLPRPLLAYGTIGLFIVAMVDPVWFTSRMQGIAVVPEPLDPLVPTADEDIDDMPRAEALSGSIDTGKGHLGSHRGIPGFHRFQAGVAVAAGGRIIFAKIV